MRGLNQTTPALCNSLWYYYSVVPDSRKSGMGNRGSKVKFHIPLTGIIRNQSLLSSSSSLERHSTSKYPGATTGQLSSASCELRDSCPCFLCCLRPMTPGPFDSLAVRCPLSAEEGGIHVPLLPSPLLSASHKKPTFIIPT